ncbi:hypothetical protein M9458_051300 [Cirrhinus mrigala]|uniref:Uncharacterized protein n=1 Tax=Cirrhinus mrigala TaxID=683832 RepID=A0ABD0MXS6_CIRMR
MNRTLKRAIQAHMDDKHTTWDRYIPQICFALRTAPHESTGQHQETCFSLPNGAGADCDNFTQNAHDRTRHDMSSTHCADADVNTSKRHSQLPDFDVDLQDHGYNHRPRLAPRITSGWSDKKWTNEYHTDRLGLK